MNCCNLRDEGFPATISEYYKVEGAFVHQYLHYAETKTKSYLCCG